MSIVWRHPHEFQEQVLEELVDLRRELCKQGELLVSIHQQLGAVMTAQDDVNSAIAALQDTDNGLDAAVTAIQAEIANLSGQGVDTSGLNDAVAQLQTHAAAVAAIAPIEVPPAV